jgi:membrane associated rhomboid family serine protease
MLERGDELLEQAELGAAAAHYARVVGHPDPDLTAAAWYRLGEARWRGGDEDGALAAWEASTRVGETETAWEAWRRLAAARVERARATGGSLAPAIAAYREAERRAPPAERAAISARLGWLTRETGDQRGAQRYFSRARGAGRGALVTQAIIALTAGVFAYAFLGGPEGEALGQAFALDKSAVAHGEVWRLLTPLLVHANLLHIFFNMYALWIVGPIVEAIYGPVRLVSMYLVCGVAASVASLVFTPGTSVGASGAIFGLFGVLFAAKRTHQPLLDQRARALTAQIGMLIVINLAIGFGLLGGVVDNAAHVGGLLAGLWLGFVLVPGNVPTLTSMWQGRVARGAFHDAAEGVVRAFGVLVLMAIIVVGFAYGVELRG